MYDFIVLGLVPGTQIQITFTGWLHFAGALCAAYIVWKLHRHHMLRNLAISLAFLTASSRDMQAQATATAELAQA